MELCSVGKFLKFRQTLGSIHPSAQNREGGLSLGSWLVVLQLLNKMIVWKAQVL
jgi:hypothetical protein